MITTSKIPTLEQFAKSFRGGFRYSAGDDKKRKGEEYGWKNNILFDQHEKLNNEGWGIYFTVNKFKVSAQGFQQRTKKDCMSIRAVFVEDDTTGKLVPKWNIPPSIIVESSPNKFHYYWLTRTKYFDEYERVMQTMVNEHNCDPKARDISRVLRVPGTFHNKGKPFEVRIVGGNLKRYKWEVIKTAFPPAEKKKSNYSTTDKGEFDIAVAVQELTTASDLHGSMIGIAMSLVNHGVNKSLFNQMMQLAHNSIETSGLDENRVKEIQDRFTETHLDECYDSAVAKIKGEKKPTMKRRRAKKHAMPVIPDKLIFPDDDYGEFIRNVMNSTPHRSNPVAAMVHGNSIVAFAADGYATSGESITSCIRIVLGETRCGKTLTMHSARNYMPADSIERTLTQLASGQGLEDALAEFEKRPSIFIALDEIGAALRTIKNGKAESSMMGRLLEIVTNGLGVMTTRPLAKQIRKILYAPRLIVSGNTTIEMSKGAITRSDIETGATNRMTFFSANQDLKVKRIGEAEKRKVRYLNKIKEISAHGNVEGPKRTVGYRDVEIAKDVAEWIFGHEEKAVKEGGSNLRGRHCELAVSWAIPRAVFLNHKKPVIDMNIFMWAYEIIELSMQTIEYLFEVHFGSDNESAEAEKKLVERLENNDGEMIKREAMNFRPCLGWDTGAKEKMIHNLIKAEVIEIDDKKMPSGRFSKVMRLVGRLG